MKNVSNYHINITKSQEKPQKPMKPKKIFLNKNSLYE